MVKEQRILWLCPDLIEGREWRLSQSKVEEKYLVWEYKGVKGWKQTMFLPSKVLEHYVSGTPEPGLVG